MGPHGGQEVTNQDQSSTRDVSEFEKSEVNLFSIQMPIIMLSLFKLKITVFNKTFETVHDKLLFLQNCISQFTKVQIVKFCSFQWRHERL